MVRNVSCELWRRAKAHAASKGITVSAWLEMVLSKALGGRNWS